MLFFSKGGESLLSVHSDLLEVLFNEICESTGSFLGLFEVSDLTIDVV